MKIKGTVVRATFSKDSKSEHDAVYLDTGEKKYRLKRRGGNPFHDDSLHKLIGKKVSLEGTLTSHFFEISEEPEELT